MRVLNEAVITAGDISTNINGPAIPSSFLFKASAQAVVAGSSPTGTLELQGSNDVSNGAIQGVAPFTPTNWTLIGSTVAVSAAGTFIVPATDICYEYIRLVWLKTSGSGTITARVKALGA